MHLHKSYENLSSQQNLKLIRECLREINQLGRQKFGDELKQQQGILARLKKILFFYPNTIGISVFVLCLIFITICIVIANLVNLLWIRITLFIIGSFLYLPLPIFIEFITPKFDMKSEERWGRVLGVYLSKTGLNLKQTERNIKRTLFYYSQEGKPIRFFVDLFWGGIFVSCLSEPTFLKALVTGSILEIFNANPAGAICIVILPFLYLFYFVNYKRPITWMEYIVNEIELASFDA
ncbi:hypothetical protein WKK05_24470 [Nostoc sp. UHCC 0302]|uniref:hypothetical protein n=1 Tax=Nostoc sp. UHCC 0302 TaxID=3134896 RepID=UPI00311CD01D